MHRLRFGDMQGIVLRWLPSGRWIVMDVLVVLWIGTWIVMGLRVHDEVEGLTELSATISRAGGALAETGVALDAINVPLVGQDLDDAAQRAITVGKDTRASGAVARDSIDSLGNLLGVSVAVIPSTPILFLYVPLRIGRVRERRSAGPDPAVGTEGR